MIFFLRVRLNGSPSNVCPFKNISPSLCVEFRHISSPCAVMKSSSLRAVKSMGLAHRDTPLFQQLVGVDTHLPCPYHVLIHVLGLTIDVGLLIGPTDSLSQGQEKQS